MKNTKVYIRRMSLRLVGIIALVAVIGLTFAACGGGSNPKALAKEAFQVVVDGMSGKISADEAGKKTTEINKKVQQMSEANQNIYNEELSRLYEQME